jgi:hypothetical protein
MKGRFLRQVASQSTTAQWERLMPAIQGVLATDTSDSTEAAPQARQTANQPPVEKIRIRPRPRKYLAQFESEGRFLHFFSVTPESNRSN